MKLESQVCSLELAQKLKELGVNKKSLFHWVINSETETIVIVYETLTGFYMTNGAGYNTNLFKNLEMYSAFTVAELGEMLSHANYDGIAKAYHHLHKRKDVDKFDILEHMQKPDFGAIMLIYLLENKLITLK